jgi:dihydrofolate reductase
MGRTQYYTATTIDGFIADENDSLDWLFQVDRETGADSRFDAFFAEVGAMAMGATTYRWVLDHERLLDEPAKWQSYYGSTPCWVFTHRSLPVIPGADIRFVHDDVAPVHAAMVEAAARGAPTAGASESAARDRNVWLVGGGDLVGQFTDRGLLDQLILGVAPVTLAAGAPVLPRRLVGRLTLAGVEQDGQFANLTYNVGP